jgi:hypothetical protein
VGKTVPAAIPSGALDLYAVDKTGFYVEPSLTRPVWESFSTTSKVISPFRTHTIPQVRRTETISRKYLDFLSPENKILTGYIKKGSSGGLRII